MYYPTKTPLCIKLFSIVVQAHLLTGKPDRSDYAMKLDSLIDKNRDPVVKAWENEWETDGGMDPEFQKLPAEVLEYDYAEGDYHETYQSLFF